MKNLLILFICLLIHTATSSQLDQKKIRKVYYEINKELNNFVWVSKEETIKQGVISDWYLLEINDNKYQSIVAGSGTDEKNIKFWYPPQSRLLELFESWNCCGNDLTEGCNLLKIICTIKLDDSIYYKEFLFYQDNLIFYFNKTGEKQVRFYFSKEQLLKFTNNKIDVAAKQNYCTDIEFGAADNKKVL